MPQLCHGAEGKDITPGAICHELEVLVSWLLIILGTVRSLQSGTWSSDHDGVNARNIK